MIPLKLHYSLFTICWLGTCQYQRSEAPRDTPGTFMDDSDFHDFALTKDSDYVINICILTNSYVFIEFLT